MKKIKAISIGFLLGLSGLALASTFNLFSPATGVLVGNASSYITTAATSANIRSLWTGGCSSANFLRGDGACVAAGAGSVTSVDLTAPGIFTVSGNPITTSGTLALTAAGTSGGVPYFSSSTGLASSGALTASRLVLGGGAGAAPTVLGSLGTTTTLLHGNAAGAPTFGAVSLSADVTGNLPVTNLNSGTSASGTTFWRGDGVWATPPAGSGTVTSVDLTMPGIFTVTGNPVTTSGTLAVAAAGTSGGIPYFSGSTTLASSAALTANRIVLGGGAGVAPTILGSLGTTTTVLHGNAAGAPTFGAVSLSADVTGNLPVTNLNSGTSASGTTFWRGDGTWATPAGGASGANPSANVGLTAVNGSAGTFMRSDGAPALDQSITPTWTGLQTFSHVYAAGSPQILMSAATPIMSWNATGAAANTKLWEAYAGTTNLNIGAANDADSTFRAGLTITRSVNAVSDVAFGNTTDNNTFTFNGTGNINVGGVTPSNVVALPGITTAGTSPTLWMNETDQAVDGRWWGLQVNNGLFNIQFCPDSISGCTITMNIDRSSGAVTVNKLNMTNGPTFTWNIQGLTGAAACTAQYEKVGNVVAITVGGLGGTCTGTSNTTGGPASGATDLPAAIRPVTTQRVTAFGINNSLDAFLALQINPSGSIGAGCGASPGAGCTASGSKGFSNATTFVYTLH